MNAKFDDVIARCHYEGAGGWKDGRLGQAYDIIADVLRDRDEDTFRHPLLAKIEELDEVQP